MKILKLISITLLFLFLIQCAGSKPKVTRLDSSSVTDITGRWNDTDSRLTSEAMMRDLLSRPWLDDYMSLHSKKPVIIVGQIRNKSSEHINTETFTKNIERELINSGKVTFVASNLEKNQIREERMDQQNFASPETMKAWANETGADLILLGSINSIVDAVDGEKVVYYQVNLELIDIESNTKLWIGEKQIKKQIERDRYKF